MRTPSCALSAVARPSVAAGAARSSVRARRPAPRVLRRGVAALLGALLPVASAAGAADLTGRVVDPSGAGVRDAVVFVEQLPPGAAAPAETRAAVMDQINKEFVPHVLPIAVGTEVSFPNHDQIHHHVYSFSRTKSFEIPLYKGETAPPVRFEQPGAVKVGCNIHDWMAGVILVVPTPYFALTDETGTFTLRGLPSGPLSVVAWHEYAKAGGGGTTRTVEVNADTPAQTFTLEVAAQRPRPAARGMRSDE